MRPRITNGWRAPLKRASSSAGSMCASTTFASGGEIVAASAIGKPSVFPGHKRRDVRERRHRHEDRHQISGGVEFGQRARLQILQFLLVDQMIADQAVLR